MIYHNSADNSAEKSDRYADSLVMNAFGLVPKIVETESEENPGLKLKYAKSLHYFIDVIYEDCLKLERTRIHGKDFVRMLRKELILLRRMHRRYVKVIYFNFQVSKVCFELLTPNFQNSH